MTEAELAAIEAKILPYRQSLPDGRWMLGEEQDDDGEGHRLPYGRFNGELWSVDKDGVDDVIVSGVNIEFATYVLGMHEHIPALIAEVRRLRAALEQLRDGEVSEQPASPPEEPEPFLYCADCTAFAPVGMELEHKPMFTCGIAQAALGGTAQE